MKTKPTWIERNPLPAFFLLAYALSWALQVPLALQAQDILATRIPFSLHYLTGFGPLLAAFIVTWRISGRRGLKELMGRMFKWRVGIRWWAVALSPLIALMLISTGMKLVQGSGLSLDDLGQIDYFPNVGIGTLLLWTVKNQGGVASRCHGFKRGEAHSPQP